MTGRELVFSDPEIIQTVRRDTIPVAADDWYQRRRLDAEGRFFLALAEQSPRKGVGQGTRQGIYLATADGLLLGWKNPPNAEVMRDFLARGLRAWRELPEEKRRPGAISVGDAGKPDARYSRTPPPGGLILKAYTRQLEQDHSGAFKTLTRDPRGAHRAARDHLWITAAEAKTLIPERPKQGMKYPLAPSISDRLVRYHLTESTRGEPPPWQPNEVRTRDLNLVVSHLDEDTVDVRLEGRVLLSTERDPAMAQRGFEAQVLGLLRHNRKKEVLERFDVVVLGEHWGETPLTRGARPGRSPLGVALRLTPGTSDADRVAPQGARDGAAYFGSIR